MAQRVAGFARRPAAAETGRVDDLIRTMDEAATAPRTIALALAPLLSPHKGRERLSLRIERLHHLARLSRGRNNGDGSWSLWPDEVDDLAYLLPESVDEAHTLAIRIINRDGGTVAMLDYPIAPGDTLPVCAPVTPGSAANPVDDSEVRNLRDELAAARSAWDAELGERLAAAAAQAAANLESNRSAWQAEQDACSAALEKRAQERTVQARERWRQASEAALSKAGNDWRAGEAARLAEAEARWREQFAKVLAEATARSERAETMLAEARAQAEADRDRSENGELRRLRAELERVKASLAIREIELARARPAAEQARDRWTAEPRVTLQKPERIWRLRAAENVEQKRERRPLIRDVAVVACLAALATMLYPNIESMIPDNWWPEITSFTGVSQPFLGNVAVLAVLQKPAPVRVAKPSIDIVVHVANVRTGPSKGTAVIATLPRDSKITPVERRGNWVRVRIEDESSKHKQQQGWVYASFLRGATDGDRKKPSGQRE
ncbi:MAG: SH3 domain-containing protein [Alphaproteobacteria bacterium]|nr:SH3 domain-containing protein [Alphaproteobacteria bacterium]MDE2630888.1 SH3 domain-containing protein [Alphaproteobacteria bacterium]